MDEDEESEELSNEELFSLKFTYDDAQDLLSGFSFELLKDLFLYNAEECVFWSFDTFSDFLNGFLLVIEDNQPLNGILSFAYSFHKAPVAYYSCYLLFEDYTAIVLFYNTIVSSMADWGPYAVIIFWNLTFNWIDILYQMSSLWKAFNLVEKQWTKIGILLAMMISDVLFKSPVSDSWSFENSSVMNEEWGEPIGFFEGLRRELDRTLEYFDVDNLFSGKNE